MFTIIKLVQICGNIACEIKHQAEERSPRKKRERLTFLDHANGLRLICFINKSFDDILDTFARNVKMFQN